jgi:hypothetical protein
MYQTEALHFGVMQFNAERRPIETLVAFGRILLKTR